MRKVFENPEITVSMFLSENIITASGEAVNKVKNMLTTENSGITLDGQSQLDEKTSLFLVL